MRKVKLAELWKESRIESNSPDSNRRIKVRLNVQGVEKRAEKDDQKGATKYFIRKAGQFIYGKQNFHKGAFGVIPKELDNFESSSDIPSFDISVECNPEWLYYYFKQGGSYKKLEKYSKGTGSKRIHPDKIGHLEIPLPSRDEQDKILKILKIREQEITEISNINDINESYISKLRQAILQEAVQGKLVPQDPNDEPASELLKKIKVEKEKLVKEGKIRKEKTLPPISEDEIPYELPKGWEWVRLDNILEICEYGTSEKCSEFGDVPVFSMGNIQNGKTNYNNLKALSEKSQELPRLYLKNKDILFNRTNSYELVGKSGIFEGDDNKYSFASYLIRIRSKINQYYLNYYLQTEIFRETQVEPEITQQTGQANFNGTKLKNTLFPLPPLFEQKRIVEKVDKLMAYCDELEKQIKENQANSKQLMEAVLSESFQ